MRQHHYQHTLPVVTMVNDMMNKNTQYHLITDAADGCVLLPLLMYPKQLINYHYHSFLMISYYRYDIEEDYHCSTIDILLLLLYMVAVWLIDHCCRRGML